MFSNSIYLIFFIKQVCKSKISNKWYSALNILTNDKERICLKSWWYHIPTFLLIYIGLISIIPYLEKYATRTHSIKEKALKFLKGNTIRRFRFMFLTFCAVWLYLFPDCVLFVCHLMHSESDALDRHINTAQNHKSIS